MKNYNKCFTIKEKTKEALIMTRGRILYIYNDFQVCTTCEFNGDMHPQRHGEDVLEGFKNGVFQNCGGYQRFVENFNRKYFGYDGELIKEFIGCAKQTFDITNNWTDYLYIINESSDEWRIKTKENEENLPAHSLAIIHYQLINKIVVREQENLKTTNILSEQEFVDIINRLREVSDLQEQVNKLFRNSRENIENDFCNAAALQISHESSVVFLLKRIMRDQYEYIDYFIYELDYGRKYETGMITDENGQDIDIHTQNLLYDFISNNGVMCQKEV